MRLLQQLDGIVVYRYRDKPELMGAWTSARIIAWPVGEPVKPGTVGPAVQEGKPTAPAQEVKPAA